MPATSKTVSVPADQAARDRIHDDLTSTLFVEAGAGTGKTRELIERIVRLVTTGAAELRHVAAITFTESAAAELRDRLRVRLEEGAIDGALSEEERERCTSAVAEIDASAIETLHAFAQRTLATHPLEAGLPPAFEVQDDIRASIAFDEHWTAFFDELLSDPELEQPLLRAFSLGLTAALLRKVALIFHENWDRLERARIARPAMPTIDLGPLADALDAVIALRRRCRDDDDKMVAHLEGLEPYARRLRGGTEELDQLRILAKTVKIASGNKGNKNAWLGIAVQDIRDELDCIQARREEMLRAARRASLGPILLAIRRLVLAYADERRAQGRLEFHDLLVQARDLLRRDTSVLARVREQYTRLLIDEFQDTDPLQIEIAALIASKPAGGEPSSWFEAEIEEGRLFFVGDPKQSIYRFRRADIALYQRAQERFAIDAVHLTQNFRSQPGVIDWVNHIFETLMQGDGQVDYVKLESWWERRPGPTVRVLGGPSADKAIEDVRRREAAELARLIQSAKSEAWHVSETDEHGQRVERPANYRDIAILMPTRTTLPPIEDALESAGVPYRVESRSLVYDTQEVRDLLSVLHALDDPTDQVALIAALRAPAFACGDDDLLSYAQTGGRWDYRSDPPAGLTSEHPGVRAMASLRELHNRRWWDTISGVVEAVIRERRLFELAFAHNRPRSRWQRLRFLLDQARAFEEAGGRTLRQFIEWAERQAQEGTRVIETVVPEPDDDAVRIMTVHAAKGLEFPIVVLAGLNLATDARKPGDQQVLWDEEGNPEVKLKDFMTAGFEALAQNEEVLEKQEKTRLLYVATTRARDHLIVSLHQKEKGECQAKDIIERLVLAPKLFKQIDVRQLGLPMQEAAPRVAFDDSAEKREAWISERQGRIDRLGRAPWRSATELAGEIAPSADAALQKDPPVEEVPPWRRGRAGTALGRAVHAVLQSIDLEGGTGIERAATAQAAAEGIATRAAEVARMVESARNASCVRQAVAGGRYWRELYVAAPIDGATLEGFVDLLYEGPDGLVVVDYKTDRVDEDKIIEAMARYRWQGAAYALSVEEVLGRPVARCIFVFAQPSTAIEREVADLRAAIDGVRSEMRKVAAG